MKKKTLKGTLQTDKANKKDLP